MIDEENVNQAIFEYAGKKYGKQSQEQFQGYIDEFPEKDWDIPDEQWLNNFLAWLFFEKVLPQTGRTIAEEFVENTTELSPEMKEKVLKMKNIIRSKFIVISKKDLFFKVKDMNSGDVYNIKIDNPSHVFPNAVITGRIHPFGDHFRFAGVFQISTSPFILDPDILMSAFENDGLKKIESILLRKGSSLQSILNKYPAHWIDWMSKHYGLKERLKKEKIQRIETKIVDDLPQIVLKLPEKSREALAFCIKQGGVVKYGQLKDYDDDMDFFWKEEEPVSTIGMLRKKGLMVVGKMSFGDRQFRVAFIPVEIREGLKSELKG
jgi:DNA-directed RNA polymerase subunit H (RpoH/RPB5)